jgi:hypothetical protein
MVGRQKLGIFGNDLARHEPRLALAHHVDHHTAVGFDVRDGKRV